MCCKKDTFGGVAPPTGKRRSKPTGSDSAIQLCLSIKCLPDLALRQVKGAVHIRKNAKELKGPSKRVLVRNLAAKASKRLSERAMARTFECQVTRLQIPVAVPMRIIQFSRLATVPVPEIRMGSSSARPVSGCSTKPMPAQCRKDVCTKAWAFSRHQMRDTNKRGRLCGPGKPRCAAFSLTLPRKRGEGKHSRLSATVAQSKHTGQCQSSTSTEQHRQRHHWYCLGAAASDNIGWNKGINGKDG